MHTHARAHKHCINPSSLRAQLRQAEDQLLVQQQSNAEASAESARLKQEIQQLQAAHTELGVWREKAQHAEEQAQQMQAALQARANEAVAMKQDCDSLRCVCACAVGVVGWSGMVVVVVVGACGGASAADTGGIAGAHERNGWDEAGVRFPKVCLRVFALLEEHIVSV